jgi:hypothetical protein
MSAPGYGEPEKPRRGLLDRYPAWVLALVIWFSVPVILIVVLLVLSLLGALL